MNEALLTILERSIARIAVQAKQPLQGSYALARWSLLEQQVVEAREFGYLSEQAITTLLLRLVKLREAILKRIQMDKAYLPEEGEHGATAT